MPLLLVLVLTAPVAAAPAADLVVIWAPGMRTTPVESAARKAGAAVVDRSPVQAGGGDTAQVLQRGIDAGDQLLAVERVIAAVAAVLAFTAVGNFTAGVA